MRWIKPEDDMPQERQTVLIVLYDGFGGYSLALGEYVDGRWLILDGIYSHTSTSPVAYWTPIAPIPTN